MKNVIESVLFVGGCVAAYIVVIGIQAGDHVYGGWGLQALLAVAGN